MKHPSSAARFHEMALRHLDAAYNFARWLAGDARAAEEVTQEAFLRASRRFAGSRAEDPRTSLLAILHNVFHAHGRVGRCEADSMELDERSPLSADEALRALPVECRAAIILREVEGLSYEDIATILDVPTGTVMSRVAQARSLLDAFQHPRKEDHETHPSDDSTLHAP